MPVRNALAAAQPNLTDSPILIDVSRLIWRLWRGGLPTGIDRVCLAYVEHYRHRGRAVVQWSGHFAVLGDRHSQQLFDLFLKRPRSFKSSLVRLMPAFAASRWYRTAYDGFIYINVGHTGLNEPTLAEWIARHRLRAFFLIHDLIPLTHPQFCRADEATKHRLRMGTVLDCAAGVIGNSVVTIEELAGFARQVGRPMPPAVAASIAGPELPGDTKPRQFDRPHFVSVGTIEGRKNHVLLLKLWARLVADRCSPMPLLVIIGQRGWEADEAISMLDRPLLKEHVLEFGRAGDREVAELIAGSRALLMPSFVEGFGLPVAEALELGTPVIASDLPVYREFAGGIPTYLDPGDEAAWEREIRKFISDGPEFLRQKSAMKAFVPPSWRAHFDVVDPWIAAVATSCVCTS